MPADFQSADDLPWFKSSYSGGNTTECLEAALTPSHVLIRDSKGSGFPHLSVSAGAWKGFLVEVRGATRY
ncbi:DUF397 domain-containing protein [Streptomyces phaeochromogenes]|uniref:DUF397 domain-containing protein n=1 Tax=Streptomyces phaeochromogenes TaxID=1923 RepID=UPI0033D7EB7F